MTYIQTTSPRTAVFYGESMADLALMPTTTKIGEGEYIHALAQEGSYAIILLTDGLKKFMLRSTGWVEVKDQGGGGSSWFEPGGNTTFAELPTPSEDNVGIVYNITDAFTTDERFNEGAGVNYPAGTNVAIVNVGTDSTPVYKFDTYVGAYTTDDELSLVSENPVQNKVVTGEINKINTALQNKQDALTFDQQPSQGSYNPVRSGGLYNSLGGKSALTFLQAYDASVSQLSAGFVFTPQGAYNMYENISRTIPAVAANVAGQAINSALPQVMPKVYWFAIQGSDWDEYGEAVIDLQNDFQIVIPQTNYNQLIVQDGLNYWNDYAMELHTVNTDESGNITTLQFVCDIYNTQDPPSNPPGLMEFIIISTPASKNDETVSLSALYESPGLKALAEKPNIDYTPSYTNTYNSMYIDQKVAGEEITTAATGADLTLSTSSGNLNALTVYGKSEVVDGAITSAGEGGNIKVRTESKNSLNITATTQTINGVTFTVNPDKTVTVNGTATATARLNLAEYILMGRTVRYLSGTPVSGSESTIRLGYRGYGFITAANSARLLNRLNTDTDWDDDAYVYIEVAEGYTAQNLLFKPMISYTEDITYEPYIGNITATFTTGTPLRGIPDTDVRDVMTWDGSAGTVTKNCGEVDLSDLTWIKTTAYTNPIFIAEVNGKKVNDLNYVCAKYVTSNIITGTTTLNAMVNGEIGAGENNSSVYICDTNPAYTDADTFKTAMNGVKLVYELATPTTETMTSTEIQNFNDLRTFEPQTHITNNAGAEMTASAYAGTENGKAVSELKQDVQSEISELKITQSNTLTLTVADWSSNAQTITYVHDTSKRNVIDVDPASVEEWANCGVLATAETASGITFSCKTVPENALNFRVTSMGV